MTATDTTRLAFLRAILSDPGDDLPRLVYADWLDENGEPDRAAYIREGIEYANWFDPHEQAPRAIDARKRLACLLTHWWPQGWPIRPAPGDDYLYLHNSLGAAVLSATDSPGHRAVLHRGFVSKVVCPAEVWLRHADELYWHPKQTAECPRCGGRGGYACRDSFNEVLADPLHCCGTGRVPRECPPTAQPLERVVFTALPPGDDSLSYTDREGFVSDLEQGGCTNPRWPGVVFEIPPF